MRRDGLGDGAGRASVREYTIATFDDFHSLVASWESKDLFRGVRDATYPLVPSVGRYWEDFREEPNQRAAFLLEEENAFTSFKLEAAAYLSGERSDWQWLALAQQHGMPTRLLDWTWNPLCALYFAVEPKGAPGDDDGNDAAVYRLPFKAIPWLTEKVERGVHPLEVGDMTIYSAPRHYARLSAQSSVLTVHPEPWRPVQAVGLEMVRIPGLLRRTIRRSLFQFHVGPKNLFPGLDGLGLSQKLWHFEARRWGIR